MKKILRTSVSFFLFATALAASGADGVAFITNMKGDVAVDGSPRPLLMSELAKGQKIAVGKESQLSVMFIQSGKEYLLKGPAEYAVGEREVTAGSGMPPTTRETGWRASNEVLVKVSQSSAASIRMRSLSIAKPEEKPRLLYPTQGSITSLQPTFRWVAADPKAAIDFTLFAAGKEDKAIAKTKASAGSFKAPNRLQPDTEYVWTIAAAGTEIGVGKFRTLPAEAIQEVEKRKPSDKSDFSDRLNFALMLQDLGATQDAREAWGKLAAERTDLPELSALAK
jgi:hypothetical protein